MKVQTHTLRAGRGRAAVCALDTQVQEAMLLATVLCKFHGNRLTLVNAPLQAMNRWPEPWSVNRAQS